MTPAIRDDVTVWVRLAAPVPQSAVQWRPDGKPMQRNGQSVVRHVAYVDAQLVRERLDAVVPGEWDLHLEPLPPIDADGERLYAFRARLSVLGVQREDVGQGRDYKSASSDAFKRAAVRFGIAHELYALPVRWVSAAQSNGHAHAVTPGVIASAAHAVSSSAASTPGPRSAVPATDDMPCPTCGGPMNDVRATKRNPKAPDYRCRDRGCPGVVWPAKAPASVVVPDTIPF